MQRYRKRTDDLEIEFFYFLELIRPMPLCDLVIRAGRDYDAGGIIKLCQNNPAVLVSMLPNLLRKF